MKRIFQNPLFWIFLVSLVPVLNLFHPGMPFVHDGQDHVVRIANFYAALREGIVVPRWGANLNWGYGHPVLMFLYPLPSYIASLFHLLGMSLVDSTKMVFGLAMVASGMSMYLWLNAAYGKKAGIVGSLLYVFAPYRFVDLYVRGALGEHVAFVFLPLVLYFLYKRSYLFASVSLAALILSHNAMALMFMPIIGLYCLYLLLFRPKDDQPLAGIIHYSLFIILGFGISAFFWIPAFFEGKYTLRDIVTASDALTRFVPWTLFFYSPWNYEQGELLSKALGFAQWAGVAIAIGGLITKKYKKERIILITALIVLLSSLFLITPWSKQIWVTVTLLRKFQFPWRFLSVSVFAAAVMGGIAFGRSKKILIILFSLFTILVTVNMWHPKTYVVRNESFYTGVYSGTTDTGESTPIWSTRFMEHTAIAPLEVIDGDAKITNDVRSSTVHNYFVRVMKPTLFLENTVYFPDWKIYVDGVPAQIQYQNPNYRGLMTFNMTEGDHVVRVVFEDTKVRKISNMISIVSLIFLIGCFVVRRRKRS